jgi:hypothetical protein
MVSPQELSEPSQMVQGSFIVVSIRKSGDGARLWSFSVAETALAEVSLRQMLSSRRPGSRGLNCLPRN